MLGWGRAIATSVYKWGSTGARCLLVLLTTEPPGLVVHTGPRPAGHRSKGPGWGVGEACLPSSKPSLHVCSSLTLEKGQGLGDDKRRRKGAGSSGKRAGAVGEGYLLSDNLEI